jgi:hypothetical protein
MLAFQARSVPRECAMEGHMRRIMATLLASFLLLTSATTVSADSTSIVDPIVCDFFIGGSMTVEPGSTILVRSGWFASTRGQVVSFMRASTWVLSVDGTPIDVTPYLVGPTELEHRYWVVTWSYPAGTLELGETMDVHMDIVLNHPNFDGSFLTPAGSALGGPVDCEVTGAPTPEE